jgi:hypothetical protein
MLFKTLIFTGLLLWLLAKTGLAKRWRIGDLPGDIRLRYKSFKIHLPFTSTALFFVILYALSRFFKV